MWALQNLPSFRIDIGSLHIFVEQFTFRSRHLGSGALTTSNLVFPASFPGLNHPVGTPATSNPVSRAYAPRPNYPDGEQSCISSLGTLAMFFFSVALSTAALPWVRTACLETPCVINMLFNRIRDSHMA